MGTLIGLTFGLGVVLVISGWRDHVPADAAASVRALPGAALLGRAGLDTVSARQFWLVSLGLFGAVALVVVVATGQVLVALVAGGLVSMLPYAVLRSRADRRRREFAAAWPDAIDNLASAVRAGLSLPEALIGLGERGPVELREPFLQFGRDYHVSGRFGQSLDLLKERLCDPTGDRVVEALRIAREVGGGDLGRMLRSLSGFLRDDLRTRGEIESRQSWTVTGARLAVAAPWLTLLLMSLQGGVIEEFAKPAGIAILLGGALASAAAYWLMLKLGRLPDEERVLA